MAKGYNALADVLVTRDGVNLNDLYAEAKAAVAERNRQRQRWVDLLTYRVTEASDDVLQVGDQSDIKMEDSSEYGLPQGIRTNDTFTTMAATGKWYDIATKFTMRALAEMSSEQVAAITNAAIEADNKKTYELVLGQVFNKNNVTFTEKGVALTAFTFWNNDGVAPPSYNGNTFPGTHNHYRTSGAAAVTSGDLDEIVADFKSHGFSEATGTQMVLFCNPVEAAIINTFRVASGALEDFVPAAGARFFTPNQLLGTQPAATWGDWAVKGAYGELLIIEDNRIPVGYIVGLASGGQNVQTNPIMLREHANPSFSGLQIISGSRNDYPLVDSYFTHFQGVGVRQRGAGLVMQITASGTYTAPSALAI
jgi:hypothetical protein